MARRNGVLGHCWCALRLTIVLGAIAVSVGGWAGIGIAHADTITVTTTADTIANDGQCSLREAVIAANSNAATSGCPAGSSGAVDAIVLGPQTYRLTIAGSEATPSAAVNDLDVTDGLTLKGAGAGATTIDANGIDRILDNFSALKVQGITFTGGRALGGDLPADGGAIRSTGTGSLEVADSAFVGNRAGNGAPGEGHIGTPGGASQDPGAVPPGGGNATGGPGGAVGQGGAISSLTPLTVTNSRFEQNAAGTGGTGGAGIGGMGGSALYQPANDGGAGIGGDGSAGGSGGAIYATQGAVIAGSSFVLNRSGTGGAGGTGTGGTGGGYYNNINNYQYGFGGPGTGGFGGIGGRGGALLVSGGPSQVTASTFTANLAGGGGDGGAGFGGTGGVNLVTPGQGGDGAGGTPGQSGRGGAIEAASTLDLTASTLSANRTGPGGNGGAGTGGAGTNEPVNPAAYGFSGKGFGANGAGAGSGAAVEFTAAGSLTNDTIVGNTAGDGGNGGMGASNPVGMPQPSPAAGGSGGSGGSGAIDTFALSIVVTVRNDTFGDNTFGAGGQGANGAAPGLAGGGGALARFAGSFAIAADLFAGNEAPGCRSSSTAGAISDQGGNVRAPATDSSCPGTAGDAGLGHLQDNGGPVATQAPRAGGAAIDAAGRAQCPATDARGAARPFGAACDAGAYELTPPAASTGAASAINAAGATLSGDVSAQGPAGSVAFEYGRSGSYGARTAAQSLDSGFATEKVSAAVKGFATGTVVHYRVVVTTPDGTALGADATFTAGVPGSSSGGGAGSRTTSPNGATATGPAPQLSHVSLSRRRFAVSAKRTAVSADAGVPLGTTFHLRLSSAASVTFSMALKSPGRRVTQGPHKRKVCIPRGRHRVSSGARCTRYAPVGALRRALRSGSATVGFSGRIGRRALVPGNYRVTIQAAHNGHRSRAAILSFTIVSTRSSSR